MVTKQGWQGRYFEDFETGDVYQHPLGRTVTTTDNMWFTLLTQNTAPIHFDHHYAAKTEFGKPLVNSALTLALVTGQSVTDVSQNVMANLGWDEVRLPNPVFEGDTVYSRSEVLEARESKSRKSVGPVARDWELAGRYPEEIVDDMKAMGLFGMLVPEEFGGIAIDAVSYSVVFEEISKAWMGVAGILGSHSLATLMLARSGTPKQRARWLPDLATGERRSGIALTEPQAGSDLQGIATVARRADDHYVVNGAKTWITNARHADPLPVLVKTDPEAQPRYRGMTILMIEQGTPGFTVGSDLGKLGYRGPESSEVFLSDCHVPVENVLGGEEGQ